LKKAIDIRDCWIFLLGTTGFIITALLMLNGSLERFDAAIQSAVFSLRNPALTAFMVPFSYSGNWQAVTPLCLLLLLVPKTRRAYGVPLTLSAISAVLFYQVLKHLFMRVRPEVSLHLLEQHGYSFPSGHSLTSFLVWGMMALLLLYYYRSGGARLPLYKKETGPVSFISSEKRLKPVLVLLILYIVLMGFSRIYVGVHWPSDVLGSWFLSLPILVALKKIIWR